MASSEVALDAERMQASHSGGKNLEGTRNPTLRVVRQIRGAPLDFEKWFRSNGVTIRTVGQRESGKSNVLECICWMALRRGCAVLDLASSRDSEALAVLMGPFPEKVRLIVADNCMMSSSKIALHTIPIAEFKTPEDGRWYVLPRAGFPSENAYLRALKTIIENLWNSDEWDKPRWLMLREAQIYLSSMSRTTGSRAQRESSDTLQVLNTEGRHHGLSIILDSQREMEVSKSLRQVSDVLIIKRLGSWIDIADDMKFMFADVEPEALRYCPINKAFMLTSLGQLAFIHVDLVPFHHRRGKSVLNLLDISIHFDDRVAPEITAQQGTPDKRAVVDSGVHREIIRLREGEGKSFDDIGLLLNVAPSTVKLHYRRHVFSRQRNIVCQSCEP